LADGLRRKYAIGLDPIQMVAENITVSELINNKYKPYSLDKKAARTFARDSVTLDRFAIAFGSKSIQQITQEDIEKYIAGKKADYMPATLNRELVTIKNLFTKAQEWHLRADSPAKGVRLYPIQSKPVPYLSNGDIQRVLAACPSDLWRDLCVFLLESGLRMGEFTSLTPDSFDIKAGVIKIIASKTYSTRELPLTPNMLIIAQKWLKEGMPEFMIESNISRKIRMIGENLDPPLDISPHTFRHTFISRLVNSGMNLRSVMALSGHNRYETLLRYSHLSPDFMSGVGERLGY